MYDRTEGLGKGDDEIKFVQRGYNDSGSLIDVTKAYNAQNTKA
jgi:hypothetical protein